MGRLDTWTVELGDGTQVEISKEWKGGHQLKCLAEYMRDNHQECLEFVCGPTEYEVPTEIDDV